MSWITNQYVLFTILTLCAITFYAAAVLLFKKNAVQLKTQRMLSANQANAFEQKHSAFADRLEEILSAFGVDMDAKRKALYVPLGRAGFSSQDATVYVVFFQKIIQPLLALIGIIFLVKWALSGALFKIAGLKLLLVAVIFLTIGFKGIHLYLANSRQKREKRLQYAFPDALDLLLVCVESGLSLDTAVGKVSKELHKMHPDIAGELDRTRLEFNVLNDRVQALQNLADRTNTAGFKALVSSLIQSEKFGTSLSDTLRVLAEDFRTTRLLNAENKAAKIPVMITIPLIGFVLFPTLVLIMLPSIMRLSDHM